MQKVIASIAALLFFVDPSAAASVAEDDYVACVVGKAVVSMYNNKIVNEAEALARSACASLDPGPSEENEVFAEDFIYHLLWDISESSMLPPQPDMSPLELGTGG